MAYQYEVGDIVKLKKKHPCGSFEWGNPSCGCGFPAKMYRLRASDHGCTKDRRKKHKRFEKTLA